jgi:hypothetical protein
MYKLGQSKPKTLSEIMKTMAEMRNNAVKNSDLIEGVHYVPRTPKPKK